MTSWKAEVIADASGKWCSNALRFKSKKEATTYGSDLNGRWMAVKAWRVKRCGDAPTHTWDDETWSAQGLPWPCPLCGQHIDDGKPCGCGAQAQA